MPKPKQACLKCQCSQGEGEGDSNSISEDADSVMSVAINDQSSTNDSSSVNWTKTYCDENLYPCPSFEEMEGESSKNTSDYTTKQLEELEDLFCPDGVIISNNYVLSSGRWDIIQDTEQGTEKLTIDKEFEQYFSMLML
ncbi:hypothetical protein CTI12_AA057590 [Artemisia annua]|uniref:Uncharacterized protein n=1 Tax=Artemisia annua TaxID=35608 RepID=A0A2U1PSZ9_ARTAN|nr:hypothetical protein CTI12_AA057590 [Artemisia annua]